MSGDGMDLCENIWSHELAMRRLLLLLRQSQNQCNDSECFLPNQQTQDDDGFMIMTICWMVVTFFLYIMRPSTIRNRERNIKPPNNGGNGNGQPPASPNTL